MVAAVSARRPEPGPLAADIVIDRGDAFDLELSLAIDRGETVALLGPNGAGKSTTVDALAGLIPLDAGRIALGSTTLDDPIAGIFVPPAAREIGIVFQDYLLFDHLTVAANVAFGPQSRGVGRRRGREAAGHWIERLDLAAVAERLPTTLSGGQAQRVALARALATEPHLLLLDEPLAALDVSTRAELRRLIVDHLQAFDGPSLVITHDPTDALVMADRIYVLEGGRTTQHGSPDEIRRRPATPYVAALAGVNLLTGFSQGGRVKLDDSEFELRTADATVGRVQAIVHPRAVSLHRARPEGSPRNSWPTVVDWIEPLGETTRVRLGLPLPVSADITPAAADALDLAPGAPVWAAVKATEVAVDPL